MPIPPFTVMRKSKKGKGRFRKGKGRKKSASKAFQIHA